MGRAATVVLLVLVPATFALADGFMAPRLVGVGEAAGLVTSPKQEAVLIYDGRTVQVILRTHFHAGPKEVAWFVPVPAKPTDVLPGRDRIFEALHWSTTPRFLVVTRGSKKPGCAAGGSAEPVGSAVVVEGRGTAGIYAYVVLAGTDAAELVGWLEANQFTVPERAEEGFRRYVDEGWHWLAMKVRPELTDNETVAPHPVVYRYQATTLVYPLAISRLSAAVETEVVLYVLAGRRYMAGNWANATFSDFPLVLSETAPSGTTYEAEFERATDERGGRLFVTEFARDLDTVGGRPLLGLVTQRDPLAAEHPETPFLTRLRAVVSLRAMDRDAVLVPYPAGKEYEWVDNAYYLSASAGGGVEDGFRLVGLAGMLGLALVLVRSRRTAWRVGAALCFATGCIIVAA
jgi:hypothetical protein